MKEKVLYVLLGVLFVNALWGWVQKTDIPNYDFLRTEHTKIRNEIKELNNTNNELTNDIKRLKKSIGVKDSIIENADSNTLDVLFDDFFNRTRRQPPMLHSRTIENFIEIR